MRKRIVLSEGKNDVHLVSSFFKVCDGPYRVKRFHGEDIQTELQYEESQAIRNFKEPRNDYHVLAKSENNKTNIQKVFAALVNQLVGGHRYTPLCVVVDLDGGRLDGFFDDLDERVRQRQAGRGITLGDYNLTKRNRHMIAATCEVLNRQGGVKGEFDVIAFKQTLERVAGTSRKEDDPDTRKKKIEGLLDEDHVFELLDSTLNGRMQ